MSEQKATVDKAFAKAKRKGGRPRGSLKLNNDLQEKFVLAVRHGLYVETAAALVGMSKQTFYDWSKKAARARERREKDPKARLTITERRLIGFLDAVAQAAAEAELRDLATISGAASRGVWQASAWRLERKFPEKYGRRDAASADGQSAGVGWAYIEINALPPRADDEENVLESTVNDVEETKLAAVENECLLLPASSKRETLLLEANVAICDSLSSEKRY